MKLRPLHLARLQAVFRFHLRSGGRVVLANTSAQVLLLFVLLGLQPDPGSTLLALARGLATGDGLYAAPWIFALWAAANARIASLRMVPAVHGWHAHLPVASGEHRRALVLALGVCQAPVIVFWLALWTGAWVTGLPVRPVSLLCLAVVSTAAAQTALPVVHGWTRAVAAVSLMAGAWLSWTAAFAALAGVGLCELFGGPLKRQAQAPPRAPSRWPTPDLPMLVAWRALGWRPLGMLATALLPVAAAWLFLYNNELTPEMTRIGVRLGGGLGFAILLLQLSAELRGRRPPWAWSRSLPWSARRRLLGDAAFLAGHALPIVLACAWLEPRTLPALLPLLAYQGIRLATALRREADGATRLGAWPAWETLLAGLWVAVTPWTSVLLLVLVPWAVRRGERKEQDLKVTRWRERHHLSEGDPES